MRKILGWWLAGASLTGLSLDAVAGGIAPLWLRYVGYGVYLLPATFVFLCAYYEDALADVDFKEAASGSRARRLWHNYLKPITTISMGLAPIFALWHTIARATPLPWRATVLYGLLGSLIVIGIAFTLLCAVAFRRKAPPESGRDS